MFEFIAQTLPAVTAPGNWRTVGVTVAITALFAFYTDFRGWFRENRSLPRADRKPYDWAIAAGSTFEAALGAFLASFGVSALMG